MISTGIHRYQFDYFDKTFLYSCTYMKLNFDKSLNAGSIDDGLYDVSGLFLPDYRGFDKPTNAGAPPPAYE